MENRLLVIGVACCIGLTLVTCASPKPSIVPQSSPQAVSSPEPSVQAISSPVPSVLPTASPEPSPEPSVPPKFAVLSAITFKKITFDLQDPRKPFALEFNFSWDDTESQTIPEKQELQLELKDVSSNQTMVFPSVSIAATQDSVDLSLAAPVLCQNPYQVRLQAAGVVSNWLNFTIPEPLLAERKHQIGSEKSIPTLLLPGSRYHDAVPVPDSAIAVQIAFRTADNQTIFLSSDQDISSNRKTLNSGVPDNWLRQNIDIELPSFGVDQNLQRWYRYSFPSGIKSSWLAFGKLKSGIHQRIQALFPVKGEKTLVNQPCFSWQAVSSQSPSQITLSQLDPVSNIFRADLVKTRVLVNGQNIGDLRQILIGLRPGDHFWWQVSIPFTSPEMSSEQVLISDWQSAQFDISMDDMITVLPLGKNVSFFMGNDQGPPDQRPTHQITVNQAFSLSRNAITNQQFADFANRLIQNDEALLSDGYLVVPDTRQHLLGLSKLDYGYQFGLIEKPLGQIAVIPGHEQHPVVGVTWFGALRFCQWLNRLAGLDEIHGFRMPSEAEWELTASLGGRASTIWGGKVQGSTANYLRSYDNFEDPLSPFTRKGGPTTPVDWFATARAKLFASFLRNTPGINDLLNSDMAKINLMGNTWEWCNDWYLASGFDPSDVLNPQGPRILSAEYIKNLEVIGQTPNKVVKGGAWNSAQTDLSPQNRGKFAPERSSYSIGFRLARSLVPVSK